MMTLKAANLSHARPGSPSWRQNDSKKIDVAWQFPDAVIEYIGVGVQKACLKEPLKSPCPHKQGVKMQRGSRTQPGSRCF